EPEDSSLQESAIAGKGESRYYVIKSASGQKNTKNFWPPKIPKTTAFNNPAKPLMTGKRMDLAGIQSFRLGRHENIYFKCSSLAQVRTDSINDKPHDLL